MRPFDVRRRSTHSVSIGSLIVVWGLLFVAVAAFWIYAAVFVADKINEHGGLRGTVVDMGKGVKSIIQDINKDE